jgi:two-component system, response regulator YesN
MAILSNSLMQKVARAYHEAVGLGPRFINLSGGLLEGRDPLSAVRQVRRRRCVALQESLDFGERRHFEACTGVRAWVVGLEDARVVHGGVLGGEVIVDAEGGAHAARARAVECLAGQGMTEAHARAYAEGLPVWDEARAREAAEALQRIFYAVSGWTPVMMEANRLRHQQEAQYNRALADQRLEGRGVLYAFEKERALLAHIRAGDRNSARRILNEMLTTIYLSSPKLVVLRARSVELMSCLTRAAIEDNPLLEPLIERNHGWTERLIAAESFEGVSAALMQALDDFIDGIYLHGVNRSNSKVRRALDYIGENYREPVSLEAVARNVGLSAGRLAHLVKEHTGRTLIQILHEVRVQHAQHLLERTDLTCAEVAYEVGFGDQSYFTKHFRRLTGTTPARYRRAR